MDERTVTVTDSDLESLSSKLHALDLTEPEEAALIKLFALAGEASEDVSGFAHDPTRSGFTLGGFRSLQVGEVINAGRLSIPTNRFGTSSTDNEKHV